jgi:hypothetical protein
MSSHSTVTAVFYSSLLESLGLLEISVWIEAGVPFRARNEHACWTAA